MIIGKDQLLYLLRLEYCEESLASLYIRESEEMKA